MKDLRDYPVKEGNLVLLFTKDDVPDYQVGRLVALKDTYVLAEFVKFLPEEEVKKRLGTSKSYFEARSSFRLDGHGAISNCEYPRIHGTGPNNPTLTLADEIYIGKNEILKKLDSDERMRLHALWLRGAAQ